MGTPYRSVALRKSNDSARLVITTVMGMVFGYFIGISFPLLSLAKINLPSSLISSLDVAFGEDHQRFTDRSFPENLGSGSTPTTPKNARFGVAGISLGRRKTGSGLTDFTIAKAAYNRDDLEECENTVKNWASSSQEFEVFEHQKTLKDFLFFLHVPRTGGKTYFHCILEQLYDTSSKCPHSYDHLRFDPRNPKCNLTVTHDDYSLMSKLPKDQTSVVTIIRNPIDRVVSSYEFAVEVAARSLQYHNLTTAINVGSGKSNDIENRGVTQDIWPWRYLVPWMMRDLFSRRDQRNLKGKTVVASNDPYNMEEILMPLHQFINEAIALDLVHNGATFQVAGLTNNSYSKMSHRVRHCVMKHPSLGEYVLEVAKRRLDNMLYIGLTDKHKESATMFANVVGDQVSSKLAQSRFSRNSSAIKRPEHAYAFRNSSSKTMVEKTFVKPYEECIKRLLVSQTHRRSVAMNYITPANFTETRHRISKRIIEEITALNNLDIQLYEYAQLIFEKQKQARSQTPMTIVIGDGMLKTLYVASWKPLLFAFPFLILLLFIFIYVNGRRRRSKSKV